MNNLFDILATIPAVIIAISFHEYAHAKMAIKLGDSTPKLHGRDTISPLKHIDPIGFICLMIAHFGWGRPVEIDIRNFKKPLRDQMFVSLAGPVMNLIIAFVTLIITYIIYAVGLYDKIPQIYGSSLEMVLGYILLINISLCIFNLLPLPNFDGSKILLYFLPLKAKIEFLKLEKYGFIIFLILVFTKVPEYIITPILNFVLNGMNFIVGGMFKLIGLI